jgi:hypothetical protein
LDNNDDRNQLNQQPQAHIGSFDPSLRDIIECMGIGISSLREVVLPEGVEQKDYMKPIPFIEIRNWVLLQIMISHVLTYE